MRRIRQWRRSTERCVSTGAPLENTGAAGSFGPNQGLIGGWGGGSLPSLSPLNLPGQNFGFQLIRLFGENRDWVERLSPSDSQWNLVLTWFPAGGDLLFYRSPYPGFNPDVSLVTFLQISSLLVTIRLDLDFLLQPSMGVDPVASVDLILNEESHENLDSPELSCTKPRLRWVHAPPSINCREPVRGSEILQLDFLLLG